MQQGLINAGVLATVDDDGKDVATYNAKTTDQAQKNKEGAVLVAKGDLGHNEGQITCAAVVEAKKKLGIDPATPEADPRLMSALAVFSGDKFTNLSQAEKLEMAKKVAHSEKPVDELVAQGHKEETRQTALAALKKDEKDRTPADKAAIEKAKENSKAELAETAKQNAEAERTAKKAEDKQQDQGTPNNTSQATPVVTPEMEKAAQAAAGIKLNIVDPALKPEAAQMNVAQMQAMHEATVKAQEAKIAAAEAKPGASVAA